MSYVSLLKNIPELLSQPTGIAAIASVGIHGAIALIVPLMPVDSNKPKEAASKSVGVLELSQVDQNRLPQAPGVPGVAVQPQLPRFPQQQQPALQQQVRLPNLNTPNNAVPPLPPSVYTQPVLPPLPTTPSNYRVSSLPTRQSLQLPKQDFRFDNSGFKAGSQKFTSAVPNFDDKQVVPETPQPLPVERLPELPPAKIPPELLNTPIPNSVHSPDITTANNSITPQPTPLENNISGNQNRNPETNVTQTPQIGNNTTSTAKLPISQPINTTNLPTKSPDTTLIAQATSYAELRAALQKQYPNSEEKAVIRDTVPVSKTGVEGTVLGVLVVDPEGKVLDIKFQDKLLSPALQLKARQYFNAKSLKGDKIISRYPFNLRFQDSSKTAGVTPEITPSPSATTPKFSTPANNSSQPTPTPLATAKPLPLFNPASSKIQPTPTPSASINRNQLSSSGEPDRSLIQKLRQVREKRDNSNPEK